MSWHALPSLPQISHWYLNAIGWVPFQAPGVAVSVPPALASPVMVGGVVLTGPEAAAAATLAVAGLCAELEPSELEAMTLTRPVFPWSPLVNLYVCVVAPGMA